MREDEFLKVLQSDLKKIEKDLQMKQPEAFVYWGLINLFGLDENDAQIASDIGGSGDGAIDALWIDTDESKIFVLQGKLHQVSKRSVSRAVVNDFLKVPERLFDESIMVSKSVNSTLKDRAREFREYSDKGFDIELVIFTTGSVAPGAKIEIDTYEKLYKDRSVQIYDIKRIMREYKEQLTQESTVSIKADLTIIEGKYFEFEIDSQRSIVFTVSGNELAQLAAKYGYALFQQNVRFELAKKKVNKGILATVQNKEERPYFWHYNNGIAMICNDFHIDQEQNIVKTNGLQIVNGCQTTMTLKRALGEVAFQIPADIMILARLTIPKDSILAEKIAEYNNSQTEVIPRDFRANDPIQISLQKQLEKMGFLYIRKRGEKDTWSRTERRTKKTIDMEKLAQILFSFYHDKPSEAKAEKAKLFDRNQPYYKTIFHDRLSAEDVILPFLLKEEIAKRQTALRKLRNKLRKEGDIDNPEWDTFRDDEFILHSDLHLLTASKFLIELKYKRIKTDTLKRIRISPDFNKIIQLLIDKAIRAIGNLVRSEKSPDFTLAKFFKSEMASSSIKGLVRQLDQDARTLFGQKSLISDIPFP